MAPNKFIIERQVAEFRADNGLSASEAINLKSLLLKLNVLTIFRPLSDNFSGMCLKGQYLVANAFWNVSSNLQVGVEYLRGWRTDFSSSTRHANRLNMLVQYSF